MRRRIAIAGAVIGTAAGITVGRTVRWWRTWGVDPIEAANALAGDDLVPTPTAIETRGITIDAPPEAVWPWLVQMGFDRAGWYSYDRLDARGRSIDRIRPEYQTTAVGDILPVSPANGFEVKVVEPGRAFVLFTDTELVERQAQAAAERASVAVPAGLAASGAFLRQTPREFSASWAFVLEPLDGGRTRLIERFRVRFGQASPAFRFVGPIMGFGVFVMMQRQMLGIAQRAIRTAVAPARPVPADQVTPKEPAPTRRDPVTAVIARSEPPAEVIATAN
jgi:proline iminopeptidase